MLALLSGYWATQCLYVLAELGVADRLVSGAKGAVALADESGCDSDTLSRLLRASVSAGFVDETAPDTFASTPLLDTLRSDVSGSLRSVARFGGHPAIWNAWAGLLGAVTHGTPAFTSVHGIGLFEMLERDADLASTFHRVQQLNARIDAGLLDALDLARFPRIVDIGGGSGGLAAQIADAVAGVLVTVVDRRGAVAGVIRDERVGAVAADVFEGVPAALAGADAYLLKHVLHDWSDSKAIELLRICRDALAPSGRVFVIESVLPDSGRPGPAAMHDINMLVLTGGRERTVSQFRALIEAAGLALVREIAAHGPVSALELGSRAAAR